MPEIVSTKKFIYVRSILILSGFRRYRFHRYLFSGVTG
jgi:hypothetical protein